MIFIVLILIAALVYFAVKSNDIGHEIKEIEKKNLQGFKSEYHLHYNEYDFSDIAYKECKFFNDTYDTDKYYKITDYFDAENEMICTYFIRLGCNIPLDWTFNINIKELYLYVNSLVPMLLANNKTTTLAVIYILEMIKKRLDDLNLQFNVDFTDPRRKKYFIVDDILEKSFKKLILDALDFYK